MKKKNIYLYDFLTPPEPKTIILCIGLQSVYFCFVVAKKKKKHLKKASLKYNLLGIGQKKIFLSLT